MNNKPVNQASKPTDFRLTSNILRLKWECVNAWSIQAATFELNS